MALVTGSVVSGHRTAGRQPPAKPAALTQYRNSSRHRCCNVFRVEAVTQSGPQRQPGGVLPWASHRFVPKPRGCPYQRLEFWLDVLRSSGCVRLNPSGSAPVVTQIVTQFCQFRRELGLAGPAAASVADVVCPVLLLAKSLARTWARP